jgi:hypothetical protein
LHKGKWKEVDERIEVLVTQRGATIKTIPKCQESKKEKQKTENKLLRSLGPLESKEQIMSVPNRPEYTPFIPTIFNYKDSTHCCTFDDTSINTTRVYREIRYAETMVGGKRIMH